MNKIIILVVALFVVAIGVLGYGTYNAQQAKRYAADVKATADRLDKKLEIAADAAARRSSGKGFRDAAKEAERATASLAERKHPRGTTELRKDARDLFFRTEKISTAVADTLDYASALDRAVQAADTQVGEVKDAKSLAVQARKIQGELRQVQSDLAALHPPKSFSKFHHDYEKALAANVDAWGAVATAAEDDDFAAMVREIENLEESSKALAAIKAPSSQQFLSGSLSPSSQKRLDELDKEVEKEIQRIESSRFIW